MGRKMQSLLASREAGYDTAGIDVTEGD